MNQEAHPMREKARADRSGKGRRVTPDRSDRRAVPARPSGSDRRAVPARPSGSDPQTTVSARPFGSDRRAVSARPSGSDPQTVPARPSGSDRRKDRVHPERTCVGCGQPSHPSALVRLVVSPDGQIAVDLAGSHFGRGAYVHPTSPCLSRVGKGLCRSLHASVVVHPADLERQIAEAVERRIWGLLSSAARSRQVVFGSDSVSEALAQESAALVVVARDAAAAASVSSVARAVAEGRAIAFGTKDGLGALFARSEVGVLALTSAPLAAAIRAAAAVAAGVPSVRSDAGHTTPQASQNATKAEDR